MSKTTKKGDVQVGKKSQRLTQGVPSIGVASLKGVSNLKKIKQNLKIQRKQDFVIEDIYEKAQSAKDMVRGETGLAYDTRMVNHRCLWDPDHQECPDRFMRTLDRCEELKLVERCRRVDVRPALVSELLTVHTSTHVEQLQQTNGSTDINALEALAARYDAVYFHPETYELALLSAGATIQLVHEVCSGAIHNGMAIVRPPGHHAMQNEFCGYCFFNNVAVAARHALDVQGLRRVLIIDWDVHHGQATQQMFYDDPRVVYFSIHRYEHGEFWPNLRESDFDYVGEGAGAGYNFNVPLNATGMSDADYMAIFHQLLLPMAAEFQPELVIVSAGYDAAIGCPEGEMCVTPACYAHLVTSLMGLASGKVAVILEGGYCLRSLAEGAALTLRALLGDPCPNLPPLSAPCASVQESILNCIYSHRPHWQCYQTRGSYAARDRNPRSPSQHWPQALYKLTAPRPLLYPTRGTCPVQTQDVKDYIDRTLDALIADTKLLSTKHRVCFVYDPMMMEHRNLRDPGHPERPTRIQKIFEKHIEYNLLERLFVLPSRQVTREELLLAHDEAYLTDLEQLCELSERMTDDVRQRHAQLEKEDSVYIHPQSYQCARLAAGSLLQVVDDVMRGDSQSGLAVVRPPGHHAESDQACGFCLFNNISIAAKYAIQNYGIKRVLILDWDVHHGNGTQRIFLSDPRVLYVSIHRHDHGTFFPSSDDGAATVVGKGDGIGYNVNIPWNQKGMGNAEYLAAFHQLVLPIAYQFAPELVLVSAGFDAAVGDPLGGCKVSPETYGLLTSWLAPLASGRVILSLEGGYNLTTISYSMTMCTKALLGDPLPSVGLQYPLRPAAVKDLHTALNVQAKHWPALAFNKDLPKEDVLRNADDLAEKLSALVINKEPPTDNSAVLCDNAKPDLSRVSVVGKQAVNSDPNKAGGSTAKDSEPGPSTSGGAATMEIKVKTTLDSILQELGMDEGFAVYPRHDCPHLPAVTPVPAAGVDVTAPCADCLPDDCATVENWVCLTCYSVRCGRVVREHMMLHAVELSHPIVMGYQDLSVWCYQCDSYIESPVLYEAKNSAYMSKFGQTMPNIYTNFTPQQ